MGFKFPNCLCFVDIFNERLRIIVKTNNVIVPIEKETSEANAGECVL